MARPDMVRLARIFFAFKRLFGPTDPVFRAGWTVKILTRKNRANFGPAQPDPTRPIASSSDNEDLHEEDPLEYDAGFGNIIVVDNLPMVP